MYNPSPPDEEARPGLPNQPSEQSLTAEETEPVKPPAPTQQPERNPITAWFSSLQNTASFLGILLAAGFSAVYLLVTIGIMGREPMVQEVTPLSVTRLG